MSGDVWVCVGTNTGQQDATWFYAFRMHDDAENFVRFARLRTYSVNWEIYPCPIDRVGDAAVAFDTALRGQREEA